MEPQARRGRLLLSFHSLSDLDDLQASASSGHSSTPSSPHSSSQGTPPSLSPAISSGSSTPSLGQVGPNTIVEVKEVEVLVASPLLRPTSLRDVLPPSPPLSPMSGAIEIGAPIAKSSSFGSPGRPSLRPSAFALPTKLAMPPSSPPRLSGIVSPKSYTQPVSPVRPPSPPKRKARSNSVVSLSRPSSSTIEESSKSKSQQAIIHPPAKENSSSSLILKTSDSNPPELPPLPKVPAGLPPLKLSRNTRARRSSTAKYGGSSDWEGDQEKAASALATHRATSFLHPLAPLSKSKGTSSGCSSPQLSGAKLKAPIVIDNGSSFIKVGIAGEDAPRSVIPCFISRVSDDMCFVGKPALLREGSHIACPIAPSRGAEINLEGLEDIWNFALSHDMQVDPREHPIILTKIPGIATNLESKMRQILFEALEVPVAYMASPAVLAARSQGINSGIVVDCGNRLQLTPILNGEVAPGGIEVLDFNLTGYLADLLKPKGFEFQTAKQLDSARKIKEATCYVALDYEAELRKSLEELDVVYKMGDGREVHLFKERFMCPEALFQPSLMPSASADFQGLHKAIYSIVKNFPVTTQRELLSHVILSGGTTLFPGFTKRLEKELTALFARDGFGSSDIVLVAPKNRKYLTFLGGSLVGKAPTFLEDPHCITSSSLQQQTC